MNGIQQKELEKKLKNKHYDIIFIGAGVISILEAVYQSKLGNSVLIVEKDDDIGGAWRPIDIFGYKNIENAIHYFLHDDIAPNFMKKNLNWELIQTKNKQRLFKIKFIDKYIKFPFHNSIGRFLSYLIDPMFLKKDNNIFVKTLGLLKKIYQESGQTSYYVKGGAVEIIKTVKEVLKKSSVKIELNTNIRSIEIDDNHKIVNLKSDKQSFMCSKLVLTHGARLPKIKSNKKEYSPVEKFHPRPAVHLLVEDNINTKIDQWIFSNNDIIKYVHDLTKFIDEEDRQPDTKVFVFALHPHIQKSSDIYKNLHNEIMKAGIAGKKSSLKECHWTDVFLPTLYDKDLNHIKNEFSPCISFLKTENFSRGIGYQANKWSSRIKV